MNQQGAGPEQRWQDLIYGVPGESVGILNRNCMDASFKINKLTSHNIHYYHQAFEGSLCVPDALYKTAFQLFDTNGNGTVCSEHILPSLF